MDSGESQEDAKLLIINQQLVECFETENFVNFQRKMDDLLLPASIAATFLNLLVIFCAFRLQRRRAAGDDSANLFIMNMAFGDLLLTLFTFPNEFLIRKHSFLRQIPFCAMNHFFNWLGLAVSALSLTLLNLDKLYFFRCNRTLPTALSLLLCLAVWAISFSFVAYIWIQEIVFVQHSDCALHMSEGSQYYYEIFVILFSILPVTSSLMLSVYLLKFIRNLDAPSQTNMATPFRDKLKSLVFIFATTAWTSFSLLPYRIFNICRIHIINWENSGCEERHILNWLAWILLYLLTLNPIVNPLITTIVYAPYRLYLKKLLLSIPGLPKSIHSRTAGDTQTGTENMNHSHISIRKFRRRGEKLQQMEMAKSAAGSNGH